MEFTSFGTKTLSRGDMVYFWKRREGNPFGATALQHPTRAHVVAAAPQGAWQHCPCSGTPQALSPPLAEPTPALTFLAPSSMGARHSGVSLRTLLTKVDTGWKTMFSVGWMSLTASWVGTSAKSSHFLMASSPSRMAGILGTRRGPRGHGAAELSPAPALVLQSIRSKIRERERSWQRGTVLPFRSHMGLLINLIHRLILSVGCSRQSMHALPRWRGKGGDQRVLGSPRATRFQLLLARVLRWGFTERA